jgi:hypothetical protein
VQTAVRRLTDEGRQVLALSAVPAELRYRELLKLNGEEVTVVG